MTTLIPRKIVSDLAIQTLDGTTWNIQQQKPERFSLLVFYRGLHCPVCRAYLGELDKLLEEFGTRGVNVIAISSDNRERAQQAKDGWGLQHLSIGYGLGLNTAQDWGLFISSSRGKTSIGIEEPKQFSEPGIFLVRPDRTLYWSAIQTMPFARPRFGDMLIALDFVIKNDYPARGEVVL